MMSRHFSWILMTLVAAGTLACNSGSSPKSFQPVEFRLAASAAAGAPTAFAGGVVITSLRLVVGSAALGSGDQFGCIDCEGDNSDGPTTPQLLTIPADGSPVSITTEQVATGHYTSAEIELARPDAAVLAAEPTWTSGATIEVGGTFNGTAFVLPLAAEGQFRETLNPPVDVTDAGGPGAVSVVVTLPAGSWFSANGTTLDPNDPAQRAQIEQNAKLSLDQSEASGADGGESAGGEKE